MAYKPQILTGDAGGTGVNNGASTFTIGGNTSFVGAFTFAGTVTGNTAVTFPTSGTLATTSQIPAFPLSLANGGTNANLTASDGGIFYSTATAGGILAGTATANQALLSGSSTTPAWSTATYPATTGANTMLLSTSANVITTGVFIAATSFTPGMSFGGGTTGITYAAQYGRYLQIDGLVLFTIVIDLSSKGSDTGTAAITGLPVTNGAQGVPCYLQVTSGSSVVTVANGNINGSATTINCQQIVTATGTLTNLADTNFANNSSIYATGHYFIA